MLFVCLFIYAFITNIVHKVQQYVKERDRDICIMYRTISLGADYTLYSRRSHFILFYCTVFHCWTGQHCCESCLSGIIIIIIIISGSLVHIQWWVQITICLNSDMSSNTAADSSEDKFRKCVYVSSPSRVYNASVGACCSVSYVV